MIRKDISNSNRFAALSPEAAVLFVMLIPHFNAHGKLNGGPGFIKDEICPKISYLTYENIPDYLREISEKTNVKWFESDGRYWIHSLNFLSEHQNLKKDRLGADKLPDYSRTTPRVVPPEVEVEVEVEEEGGRGETKQQQLHPGLSPNGASPEERGWLDILKEIPKYPFDEKKDLAFLREKAKDFPEVDISSLLKNWKSYILDKPFKKKASPRGQLHSQFDNAVKYGRHLKERKIYTDASGRELSHG